MFFDDPTQIPAIAAQTGTSIFVVPDHIPLEIPHAITLKPEEKSTITIEQIRASIPHTTTKQSADQFVLIRPADKLTEVSVNALLKTLEEPNPKTHFILVTSAPSLLLPTILSRAQLYFLNTGGVKLDQISSNDKVKALAKKFLVAKPADLPALAEELTKKKDSVRAYALEVIGTTIEMLYKSYLLTGKSIFLAKLPRFLTLYDHIAQNGHIKLHLVADLI